MTLEQVRGRPRWAASTVVFLALTAASIVGWLQALSFASTVGEGAPPTAIDLLHDLGGGLAFGVAGFVVWWRRPGNLTGPLMVIIGISLLVWVYEWLPAPPLVTLAQLSWGSPPVLIGALLLVYPSGRVHSRFELAWLVGAAVLLGLGILHALVTPIGKWTCADCHSWIALTYDENISNNVWLLKQDFLALLGLALVAILARRWLTASLPTRRVMTPLWIAGLAFVLVVLATVLLDTSGYSPNVFADIPNAFALLRVHIPPVLWLAMPYVATAAMFLIPLALLWGQIRMRWGHTAVSALAIQLRRTDGRGPLVGCLQQALGDPSLQLALWSRPARAYVTPEGVPITLPAATGARAVTYIDGGDGHLAAMIHDPALAEQRQLIDGVSAVAQLAIENERLHAEVKAQLEEVRASRERIVAAADEERRRVERNIHDGAQQRLVSLSLALSLAQAKAATASPDVAATLAEAEDELKHAIGELRELARGIHPAILTEAGLAPALESLAEHSPIPVEVDTELDFRLAPVVEATAYFVVAEALTNVAKHAGASAATLSATVTDGRLRVRVADNGRGGADPERGSGLRGLQDRVAALGGWLRIADDPSGGTRLEAELPCG